MNTLGYFFFSHPYLFGLFSNHNISFFISIYRDKEDSSILDMYRDRARMHKVGYQHRGTKIVDRMMVCYYYSDLYSFWNILYTSTWPTVQWDEVVYE